MNENKKNLDDEYESFMSFLRGNDTSPSSPAAQNPTSSSQTNPDEEDAFNVINAVGSYKHAPSSSKSSPQAAAEPQKEEPVRQYIPTPKRTAAQPSYSPAASTDNSYLKVWKSIPDDSAAQPAAAVVSAASAVYNDADEEDDDSNFISHRKNRQKRTRFKLLKSLIWLLGMLIISFILAIFIVQSCGDVFGYDTDSEDLSFTVLKDDTSTTLAKRLAEQGLIQQEVTFRFYAKFKDMTEGFTPGTYTLNPDMSYDEILSLTRQHASNEKQVVKVTFREGLTVYEIAELLEENKVCSADEFLHTLETENFTYSFMESIPSNDPLRFRKMEGYLFPDTYDFYIGENPVSVAKKFFNNFNNKITASMYEKLEAQGITLDELVTLASIVQKEAGRAKEMYRVSSVFRNRMNSDGAFPLLQSDTTTNYIENSIKPYLTEENPELITAYDTYSSYGLPSGPICNPGINALRAALDPAETPYYFFLSDEKGKYYYAKNYTEHQNNAAKAARVGDGEVHGIGVGQNG